MFVDADDKLDPQMLSVLRAMLIPLLISRCSALPMPI